MVDHGTAIVPKAPGTVGPPETITPEDAGKFLALIRRGLSDDMAAGCVRRSVSGLKDYCHRRPELSLRLGEAKAHKVLYHMKNLDRISRTRDVRGYNAAVKASEKMLSANDPRFRKDPDAMTPGVGGGVTIIVKTGSEKPSGHGFAGTGGIIDAEAVTVLESRSELGADAGGPRPEPAPAELADLLNPEPPEQPGRKAAAVVAADLGGEDPDGANEAAAEEENDGETYF